MHHSHDHPPLPSHEAVEAWIGLMRAQRTVLAAIERDLKAAGHPPLAWYDVLFELSKAEEGRLRPFEIERRTLLAQYNLSRLVDRLEKEGLVERHVFDNDGRGRWVAITPAGRELRLKMWEVYEPAIERHLGARISGVDANVLATLLSRLA